MSNALTAKYGAIWIQPGGSNYPTYLLLCTDAGDLTEPKGGIELIRCYDENGKLKTVGQTESPPDAVSVSLTQLIFPQRSYLENLGNCNFTMYFLMRDGGRADVFSNYRRGQIVANGRINQNTWSCLAVREEDAISTFAVDAEAWPPVWLIDLMEHTQLPDPGTNVPLQSIWVNTDTRCQGEQGLAKLDAGQIVYVGEAPVGATQADLLLSDDGGATFVAAAANPFANTEKIMGIAAFWVSRMVRRILAVKEGTGGAVQGESAYSDDAGATWTIANIGGAAAGHGPKTPNGVYALDWRHIWMAGEAGYIYFSEDGGQTWTAVESGVIMVGDYNCVHFADSDYGIAGGAGGVVSVSSDGGATWQAATIPVASAITGCARLDKTRMWVTCTNGTLWYSIDEGVTWTQRTGWAGSGTGTITSLAFPTEYFGYFVKEDAGGDFYLMRTFDGGYSWEAIALLASAGNVPQAVAADYNKVYVVGDYGAGPDPYIGVIDPA